MTDLHSSGLKLDQTFNQILLHLRWVGDGPLNLDPSPATVSSAGITRICCMQRTDPGLRYAARIFESQIPRQLNSQKRESMFNANRRLSVGGRHAAAPVQVNIDGHACSPGTLTLLPPRRARFCLQSRARARVCVYVRACARSRECVCLTPDDTWARETPS